ncbi:hypothetical protein [Paenibacillus sp. MABNR03]|uniref:hypothetical protein n=1 Tax=Paenibacillus sp. MABNR03 TaxID=3142626 RepID=UPI003D2E0BAE
MFTYKEYGEIIQRLRDTGLPFLDYKEITEETKSFVILRHDVEFSLSRAHKLAYFESNHLDIKSSYFIQISNNCYNPFSEENIKIIRDILRMGHRVGLHYHLPKNSTHNIVEGIKKEIGIFSNFIETTVDRFSFHRPTKVVLSLDIKIDNLINSYASRYFNYCSDNNLINTNKSKIFYLSDSQHKWKFGYPNTEMLEGVERVQILTHPYSWSEMGGGSDDNFENLFVEKKQELMNSMNEECSHFPYERIKLYENLK